MGNIVLYALVAGGIYYFGYWRTTDSGALPDGISWKLQSRGGKWRVVSIVNGDEMIVGPFANEAEARGTIG